MKIMLAVMMLIIASTLSKADEIRLKDGRVWKNVQILDEKGEIVTFKQFTDSSFVIVDLARSDVAKLEYSPVQEGAPSLVFNIKEIPSTKDTPFARDIQYSLANAKLLRLETRHPNLALLGVTLGAFLLAYDSFSDASSYSDDASAYDKLASNSTGDAKKMFSQLSSNLQNTQKRKTIVGIGCVVAGLTSLVMAFQTEHWAIFSNGMEIKIKYTL